MKYIAFLLAAAAVPTLSFTMPGPMRTVSPVSLTTRSPLFMTATAATNSESPNSTDSVLRDIEKQQLQLNKRRDSAIAKLNAAQTSLQALDLKKKDYLNGLQLKESPPGGNFSETTARSAVKALCWRIIAGSVTFITSYQFSKSMRTALTIVGSDFFSKAFTMFIGERLMNKSQAGRKGGADDVKRSLAKALVWRVFAIANTLTMAVFISKDLSMASKIAGSDAIFKTGLMFFYERAWANIRWGKEFEIEFSI
eukprot:CAMPEP_0119014138 /NCGR_PEP_ID=MMETSP1176-20130426/9376_1 /TAXON_ID=265551 /ORGANISM="Synedropsis recta cf, Strain CCMP1620" /LENGTH=252 /DNA_ID=CAMNT_0006967279 /DNA_START=41 /DNA_END=799 /DNA_ORIENTATION=-